MQTLANWAIVLTAIISVSHLTYDVVREIVRRPDLLVATPLYIFLAIPSQNRDWVIREAVVLDFFPFASLMKLNGYFSCHKL